MVHLEILLLTRHEPHGNSRTGIIKYFVFLQILSLSWFFCLFCSVWGARVQDQRTSVTCLQSRGGRSCRARLMNSTKTFKRRWTRGIFKKHEGLKAHYFLFLQVLGGTHYLQLLSVHVCIKLTRQFIFCL